MDAAPGHQLSNRIGSSPVLRFLVGDELWTPNHCAVFLLTFTSYALVHASRKTLSTVKPSLISEWTDNTTYVEPLFADKHSAESFLAFLDGAFLGAYALVGDFLTCLRRNGTLTSLRGLYVGGTLGDRYDPAKVLAAGMWTSSVTIFLFGTLSKWLALRSLSYYTATWIACGLFQSVAWPTEIAVMGSWFGHNSRGAVLGLWSACASVGNILGTLVSSQTVQMGYEYSFAANSGSLFVGGILIFFCLSPSPHQHERDAADIFDGASGQRKAISFWRAWFLPGVIAYSLAYACLKLVNYSFFFWLPFYLHAHYGWKESLADELSAWYDLGGIVAAVVAGIASDRFSSRTPILVSMLVMSMGALFFYANSPNSVLVNSLLMALTGFFVGGPANLISSAVSADLGKAEVIRGSAEALSTVTGIIDGTGSVGAGIGQLLIPKIEARFGWIAVFYGFIAMMFSTILCLVPLLWREMNERARYVRLRPEVVEGDVTPSSSDSSSNSETGNPHLPVRIRHRNPPED
ncbi:unnamed protein product [Gongylonema pulchrum]|uniref:Sugar phosphate exchanger 3 n=1 Tax=Gongylonema pulchrum TaxID=637853 RepID=A0A183DYS3_9BILA|nr:unnamed protein product [Gongylonema pulchrum]